MPAIRSLRRMSAIGALVPIAVLTFWLAAAPPAAARSLGVLGTDGLWIGVRGDESIGFELARDGRRILDFDGGLSPLEHDRCWGRTAFDRIRVSPSGRFSASYGGEHATMSVKGRFTSRRRAVVTVQRIEYDDGVPACDSGPVRFTVKRR